MGILEQYDEELDRLYSRAIRCPYCKKKIPSFQKTCEQCGLDKIQIIRASNARAKNIIRGGEKGKIIRTRRRPDDLSFTRIIAWLGLGMFGAHNFYTGRRVRAWIMFICATAFILGVIIFPIGNPNDGFAGIHPWRDALESYGGIFPTDLCGTVALVLWFSDLFGVVFGWYKYPVRLGDHPNMKKILDDEVA